MKQYPSAIKEKVRNQIAAGRSQKEISREYGISKYTPMWHFIPNFHSLPFFVWCISGSRAFSAFLGELGALMMVASTMVPALHHVSGLYHDAVDCIEEQFVQAVCLQKMTEFAQRCFVRNRLRHEVNACEFSHGVAVVDGILGSRIGQIEPDLQQIHPQHFFNAHGRTATLSLGIVGFDNTNLLVPGNDLVHDFQKFSPLRFLLAEAVFDIRKCFLFLHRHTPPLL